jgi:hypothetical protein
MKKDGLPISVSRKDFITRAQQCDVALGFETLVSTRLQQLVVG